ncbi:cell division protein ZapE [Microbacterium sp. Marseille-Q6965]|uniref:cell division protein ZapE n=1 Tax=Microbacterium sp. Marseille-Q6965 TaxID=2965072 RepID=UPI0021B7958A|nr:cell division protein ZapE [Microbacterium sp. Marseille-Q6965]
MTPTHGLVRAVEAAAAAEGFALDPDQQGVLHRLAALGSDLSGTAPEREPARGLYLHGDAGRGKTWLADAFFTALPIRRKTRVHFHGFFDELHRRVFPHRSAPGALERALDDVIGESRLLLFDELHLHDSGDARLLTRLLEHVFTLELTVVATSNYAPDDLLPDPIWHHTAEPGIALIKGNMDVCALRAPIDYRTLEHDHTRGFASGTWSTTPPPRAAPEPKAIHVRGRAFLVTSAEGGELTATFDQLCRTPTSTAEYLEWSRQYTRWAITGIPAFGAADPQAQQRFINLVDVLVDADVPVRFFAAVDLDRFLADASQRPDAFRMASRLQLVRTADAALSRGR